MTAGTANRHIVEDDCQGVQHDVPLEVEKPRAHLVTRLQRRMSLKTYLGRQEHDGAVGEDARDGNVIREFSLELTGTEIASSSGTCSISRLPATAATQAFCSMSRGQLVDSTGLLDQRSQRR